VGVKQKRVFAGVERVKGQKRGETSMEGGLSDSKYKRVGLGGTGGKELQGGKKEFKVKEMNVLHTQVLERELQTFAKRGKKGRWIWGGKPGHGAGRGEGFVCVFPKRSVCGCLEMHTEKKKVGGGACDGGGDGIVKEGHHRGVD